MSYRAWFRELNLVFTFCLVACGGQVGDEQTIDGINPDGIGGSTQNAHSSIHGIGSAQSQGGAPVGGTVNASGGMIGITFRPSVCGDSFLTYPEECDDGNTNNHDGCSATCDIEPAWCDPYCSVKVAVCGDGQVATSEVCDDGNLTNGDGCDSSCVVETGWRCPYAGMRCSSICGDELVVGSETCDSGTYNGKYVAEVENGCSSFCRIAPACTLEGAPSACPENCAPIASGVLPEYCTGICGDAIVDWNEQCDNGASNTDEAYGGCTTQCQFGPFCGDGIRNGDEECDLGVANNATYGVVNGCSRTCHVSHYCGDGIVDTSYGEACDVGSLWSQSNGCYKDCSIDIGP